MRVEMVTIRDADPDRDSAACAEIYAPFVEEGPTSFEEVPPSPGEMAERIRKTSASHPWLVAERDGELAGYAYACPHRSRPAYRWSVDVSVYVAPSHQRQGLGRHLYEKLFERLRDQGFRVACAGITLPNDPSVALHESLGFEPVGVYKGIGWKAGAWRDVGWWLLRLAPQGDETPAEPAPPIG